MKNAFYRFISGFEKAEKGSVVSEVRQQRITSLKCKKKKKSENPKLTSKNYGIT